MLKKNCLQGLKRQTKLFANVMGDIKEYLQRSQQMEALV